MARPSFPQVYMQLAFLMSQRSTCERAQVGAVITSVDYRHVYAVGYNGSGAGLPNGCRSAEPGLCGHLHAEENACINCTAPSSAPKVVFATHMPCFMCAQRLINLGGVQQLYYGKEYRLVDGVMALRGVGIPCDQLVLP
jgi:dCMP deaminase